MSADASTPGQNQADHAVPATVASRAIGARQVWLPRPIYVAIPWIYLGSGTISLLGGLYLPEWAWRLPYAVLFSVACLHTGIRIAYLRRRRRQHRTAAVREAAG
jgi:hypothetical protein